MDDPASEPRASPAQEPADNVGSENGRRLRRVRWACALSAGLMFVVCVGWLSVGADWIEWLAFFLVWLYLALPFLVLLRGLSREQKEKALGWARSLGWAGLCTSVATIYLVLADFPAWAIRYVWHFPMVRIALIFCLLFAMLTTTLAWESGRLRKALYPQARSSGHLALGAASSLYFILIPFLFVATFPFTHSRAYRNSASAVFKLKTLHRATLEYQAAYRNGFPPSLAALGPAEDSTKADCNRADMIDAVLATGTISGYEFVYTPGQPIQNPAPGCPAGVRAYRVAARPLKYMVSGIPSFYLDESGVIRATNQDRAGTPEDPALN